MSTTLGGRCSVTHTLFLVGCGGSTAAPDTHRVSAKNYDSSCASVADCVPFFEGTLGCCGLGTTCPNAAISAAALPKYTSDAQRASTCMVPSSCPIGIKCASGRITCTAGVCALEMPSFDAAPNHDIEAKSYDRTCASVADCMAIIEGTAGCCGFGIACPNAAINVGALAQYVSDVERATACDVPPPCLSPAPETCSGRIACAAGSCALDVTPADAATSD